MKRTKSISIVATIVALISTQYAQSAAPVLEIYNKSKNIINVTVRSNKATIEMSIDPNTQRIPHQPVDINSELSIFITEQNRSHGFYIKAPGKTKYLTWNPAKKTPLYPETGPLMGFMGKTESGLSLKNNVTRSEINQIK